MSTMNPHLDQKLEAFGVSRSLACFNCGTCTSLCPIDNGSFPRRYIRYVQIGAEDQLLQEGLGLWQCLHCGLCTATCPREANPGELMHGLKRYVLHAWRRN